jgi:hypothetical protein
MYVFVPLSHQCSCVRVLFSVQSERLLEVDEALDWSSNASSMKLDYIYTFPLLAFEYDAEPIQCISSHTFLP